MTKRQVFGIIFILFGVVMLITPGIVESIAKYGLLETIIYYVIGVIIVCIVFGCIGIGAYLLFDE